MKTVLKRVLKFYFAAEELNNALDKIIYAEAALSYKSGCSGTDDFDRVAKLVETKGLLSDFWVRLNGVMGGMTERDVASLKYYASLRCGTRRLPEGDIRELHRAVTKFGRRAEGVLKSSGEQLKCVRAYYCLIPPCGRD